MRLRRYKVGEHVWVRSLIGFDVRKGVIIGRGGLLYLFPYHVRLESGGVLLVSRKQIHSAVTS